MGKYKKKTTDILIRTSNGTLLEFMSITTIYKNDVFFSYKLSLPFKDLFKVDNLEVDGITGKERGGKITGKVEEGLQVTYHPDGMVMFKDFANNRNIAREKHRDVKKLSSPTIFFQFRGLPLQSLEAYKSTGHPVMTIPLSEYSITDYINCDFFIGSSNNPTGLEIPEHSEHIYPNPWWFEMIDQLTSVAIYAFIYRYDGIKEKVYLDIPSRKVLAVIGRHIATLRNHPRALLNDYFRSIKLFFIKLFRKQR